MITESPQDTDLLTLDTPGLSPYQKLTRGIMHLDGVKIDTINEEFLPKAKKIMEILTHAFKQEKDHRDFFLPWVKFFDVAYKSFGNFNDPEEFRNGIEDLVQSLLRNQEGSKLDWRIARKMLAVKIIFNDAETLIPSDTDLITPLKFQLQEAIDFLDWGKDQESLARKTIKKMLELFEDKQEDTKEELQKAIIAGRFDKDVEIFQKFGLRDTIILGEDGGLYLLLNSLQETEDQEKKLFIEKVVGAEYLRDKIKTEGKVIIGKGGFGTVRFALNLLEGVKNPGDLICIKKSRSFDFLKKKYEFMSPIETITTNTLGDYLTNDLAGVLYAPKVVDMALIHQRDLEPTNKKGYLMMEIAPQNTGNKMFNPGNGQITECQKWEHQKPYILDVLRGMAKLLEHGVAMTDLKPENTLYDKDLRQAIIIDLGGTVKPEKKEEMDSFDQTKYDFQFTEFYAAPELGKEEVIDLTKSIAFACGRVIQSVTETTDFPDHQEITDVVQALTHTEPKDRISIEQAIERIQRLGSDDYKEHIIFTSYINKVKDRITSNDQSSLGLNDDIKETKELLIPLQITFSDPYKFKDLKRFDFNKTIAEFFNNNQDRVFLLLGAAGSGKSIGLQLKFIEAVENWRLGDPLPIYFNLANSIDLDQILEKLNQQLKTGLSVQRNLYGKRVNLFVDSFDEGFYPSLEAKEKLIPNFLKMLGETNTKIFVSCRSDFSIEDQWFRATSMDASKKFYVAPLDWKNETELKNQIQRYLKESTKEEIEQYTKRITRSGVSIDTGFLFKLIMGTLPSLRKDQKIEKEIVFRQFSLNRRDQFLKNYTEKQKEKISKSFSNELIQTCGEYLATELHINGKHRLSQDTEFFRAFLDYKPQRDFHHQLGYHLLQLLPLKIEVNAAPENNGKQKESVTIGFAHDIVKNYYLAKSIFKRNKDFQILSSHSLKEDTELIRYLAEVVRDNDTYKKRLFGAIFATRTDKSTPAVTYSANAMTILVASRFSFSEMDLSNVSIQGANLSFGVFHKTNFTGADLTDVVLRYSYLNGAIFSSTIMTNIQLGAFPDLKGHTESILCVQYSPDGKTLATASCDRTIRIWDSMTGKELQKLVGHYKEIHCIAYSPRGKTIASASDDGEVKIWDLTTGKVLQDVDAHRCRVHSIAYSPDGKMLASAAIDFSVIISDTFSGKELQTLIHAAGVRCVAFSPDGQTVASITMKGYVTIWNVFSGAKVKEIYTGKQLTSLAYSPDGKKVAAGVNTGAINIWDTLPNGSGSPQELGGTGEGIIHSIAYSPDGKTIAMATNTKNVVLWDVSFGSKLQTFSDHTNEVNSVAFSPDGRTVASAGDEGIVKIFEVLSGKEVQRPSGLTEGVSQVIYARDGKTFISKSKAQTWGGTSGIYDSHSGEELQILKVFNDMAFSPDGTTIISNEHYKTVGLSVFTGKKLWEKDGHSDRLVYSPDGTKYAEVSNGVVTIWDVFSGEEIRTFKPENPIKYPTTSIYDRQSIFYIEYSPDGERLVFCDSITATVKILDTSSGGTLHTFQGKSLLCSPDGKTIAIRVSAEAVKIYDAVSGKEVQTFKVPNKEHLPNGESVIVFSDEEPTKIVDADGKKQQLSEGHIAKLQAILYSPNGKMIKVISEDRTPKIFDVFSGQEIPIFEGKTGKIKTVSFSADGKTLALSTEEEQKIKILNISSGQELQCLDHPTEELFDFVYFADGVTLLSLSALGTVRIWDAPTGKELVAVPVEKTGEYYSISRGLDGKTFVLISNGKMKIWEKFSREELKKLEGHASNGDKISGKEEAKSDWSFRIRNSLPQHYSSDGLIIDKVINLSDFNLKVFEGKGCIVQEKPIQKEIINQKSSFSVFPAQDFGLYLQEQLSSYRRGEKILEVEEVEDIQMRDEELPEKIEIYDAIVTQEKRKEEAQSKGFWKSLKSRFVCASSKK